jgi:hypothetical protein
MKHGNLLVYIAGPMTAKDGYSIEENVAAGLRVYLELLQAGVPAFCPHLSGAFPSAWSALDHAQWLAYDKAIIDRCTHMLLLPRWQTSTGAVVEEQYAAQRGLLVVYSVEEVLRGRG